MKIHEYQAKELFRAYDIPVPAGLLCETPEAIDQAVEELGLPLAVKAQVHAGGRGKGGGVRVAKTVEEAREAAEAIIGMQLVTLQTGAQGTTVHKVLAEEGVSIKNELYLSFIVNRDDATVTIMASQDGGMDIEEVAAATPERIIKVGINPLLGIQGYHVRQVVVGLELEPTVAKKCGAMLRNLYRLFTSGDCSLLEINPLIITEDDNLIALDAKMDIDSNALYRQKEISAMRDPLEEDPNELEAAKYDLNYIKLDGTIGNMVNGAGLAMATMDIIKQAGAEPARIRRPSSTLVPSMRTTTGTSRPRDWAAWTTPWASTSQRKMPPKILIRIPLTLGSLRMMRKPFSTFSALAPPPTSRKLAGSAPACLMMSMVAIARPAPFTMFPMVPSSLM